MQNIWSTNRKGCQTCQKAEKLLNNQKFVNKKSWSQSRKSHQKINLTEVGQTSQKLCQANRKQLLTKIKTVNLKSQTVGQQVEKV